MQFLETQLPKVLGLAVLAVLAGIVFLQFDAPRRATAAPRADSAATAPVDRSDAVAASPAGTVVGSTASPSSDPVAAPVVQTRGGVSCVEPHQIVQVPRDAVIRSRPGGRAIGTMPASSKYMGQSMTAWVQAVSTDGRWGKVAVPWTKPVTRSGWVSIAGLPRTSTSVMAVADLSTRRMTVYRGCRALFSVRTAIGRPGSPSPRGRFWVTDRVTVPGSQRASFGTFAFGMSTVQPNLPAGWAGGDQMAVHGTGEPGSVGQAVSAGCLRVDERAIARLRPVLRAGTPIVITA